MRFWCRVVLPIACVAACSSRATAEWLKVDISTVGQSKGWAPGFTQWIPPAINGNVSVNSVHGPEGPAGPFQGVDPGVDQPYTQYTRTTPFFESYVETQTAAEACENVLADVGCNRPMLDDHDLRVINEARHGTFTYRGSITSRPGLPDNQADVGGWEDYPEIHRPTDFDTDQDGLPDGWEVRYGLNPHSPAGDYADANGDLDDDGYTNLEGYLHDLARGGSPIPGDAGMAQTQIDDGGGNPSSEDSLRLLLR